MKQLKIGVPFLRTNGDKTQLVAEIREDNNTFELWYETEKEYACFLCPERIDAFVVGILPYAMKKSLDIVSDATISEKLELQLNKFLIPTLTKYSKIFNSIKLETPNKSDKQLNTEKACGTGFSRGVDSFYTIQETAETLTHLTFFNVGSHRSTNNATEEESSKLYQERLKTTIESAKLFKLPLVSVNSNLGNHLNAKYVQIHHFCSFSAVLAMQKLFKNYYYSSGYPIDKFSIKKCDLSSANYESYLAHMLSTESTSFYITGLGKTRLDKVKAISEYELSYDNLNVCVYTNENCSNCEKCCRTELELLAIGKHDLYKNAFNLEMFEKNHKRFFTYMFKHQNVSSYKEILDEMHKNGYKFTFREKLEKTFYKIIIKLLRR